MSKKTVHVNAEIHKAFKLLHRETGVSMGRLVNDALEYWLIEDADTETCEGCGEWVLSKKASSMQDREHGTLYFCKECFSDEREEVAAQKQ